MTCNRDSGNRNRMPLVELPFDGNLLNVRSSVSKSNQKIRPSSEQDSANPSFNSSRDISKDARSDARTSRPLSTNTRMSTSRQICRASVAAVQPVKARIGPWHLGSTISAGSTCTVRMVRHVRTGENAVAKVISKVTADKVCARSLANLCQRLERGDHQFSAELKLPVGLEREIVIMRLLRHPNIVRLYDVWENSNEIYIIMENVKGGELFHLIQETGPLSEVLAMYLFRQLVDALLYCHRLQIFHRDLKPENILIDRNSMQVKLIDFGMSAYQPNGDLLKTPCGSPHYAAPELLEGHAYDGSKADVWSLGVVLFIMLTESPPFNMPMTGAEDIRLRCLYEDIKACKYKLPRSLSKQAKDLFRRIFVRNPAQRLSIVDLWKHALLHKYDKTMGYEGGSIETWIGSAPNVHDWIPLTHETVNGHILRHLRTLWHDTEENVLVSRLCDPIMNQEKYFYKALSQYHEEQVNCLDYGPAISGLAISESDYQHSITNWKHKQVKSKARSRSISGFSIYQEEHIKSKHSFFEEDTVKNSQECLGIPSKNRRVAKYQKRVSQPPDFKLSLASSLKSQSHTKRKMLRVKTPKRRASTKAAQTGRRHSSTTDVENDASSLSCRHSKSHSRHSTSNSPWSSSRSPLAIAKPGERHKRNVSFDHKVRRSNQSGDAQSAVISTLKPKLESSVTTVFTESDASQTRSSLPSLHILDTPMLGIQRSHDIEKAARKVSTELGKACEAAFFRSSVSDSSFRSSVSDVGALDIIETPPSSVSNRSPHLKDFDVHKGILNRPLPPVPQNKVQNPSISMSKAEETPRTYTKRELREMRQRFVTRYEKDGVSNKKYYNDILKQLDSIMPQLSTIELRSSEITNESQYASSHEDTNLLQPIPEEGLSRDFEDDLSILDITDAGMTTIRIVEPSSPPTIPQLSALTTHKPHVDRRSKKLVKQYRHSSRQSSRDHAELPLEDDADISASSPVKGGWWRRTGHRQGRKTNREVMQPESNPCTVSDWEDLDDRTSRRNERANTPRSGTKGPKTNDSTLSNALQDSEDRYYRACNLESCHYPEADSKKSIEEKKTGFFKDIFKKKAKSIYRIDRTMSVNLRTLESLHDWESRVAISSTSKAKAAKEWSLLGRILRVKPESKVVILSHNRKAGRNMLCKLLFSESNNGIKDIARDENNRYSFTCSLGKENKWGLKSVSFVVEFFSILRDGKQAKITAVRFTQVSGSGLALRRLVDLLVEHLENGHLHQDIKEAKDITKLIQTGRIDAD